MLEMPARCSRCDSISPAGPAPTMPTCVRMAPPRFSARMRADRASSKGWKPESLARLAPCGTNPQAAAYGCRAVPRSLCLGQIKKPIHQGETIMHRISLLAGITLVAFATLPMAAAPAQTVALSGQVTSTAEGAMEGVLVSAKKAGSTITITVVSDRDGRFSFPASKIEPGQYALRVRAIGYDLDNHKSIDVAPQKTTTLDLKLRKTEDLAAQLSNAEWINSIPGNDPRKG